MEPEIKFLHEVHLFFFFFFFFFIVVVFSLILIYTSGEGLLLGLSSDMLNACLILPPVGSCKVIFALRLT